MQQQAVAMRHSFRTELIFSLEVGFLENDILSFYRNVKPCQKMLTTIKTNINIINNNNNNNNDNSSIITHVSLQIDAHENIDEQNNSVTKELMKSTLIIKEFGI